MIGSGMIYAKDLRTGLVRSTTLDAIARSPHLVPCPAPPPRQLCEPLQQAGTPFNMRCP